MVYFTVGSAGLWPVTLPWIPCLVVRPSSVAGSPSLTSTPYSTEVAPLQPPDSETTSLLGASARGGAAHASRDASSPGGNSFC